MPNAILSMLVLFSTGLAASSAHAQGQEQRPTQRVSTQALYPVLENSDNQSGSGFLVPAFQVLADVEGDTTGQLSFALVRDNVESFGETTFGLTLSAPINESTDEASLITRRGIPSGFGAELSIGSVIGRNPDFSTGDPTTGPVRDWLLLTNLSASIGVDDYAFRDPATFEEQEQRRTSYAFSASLGYMPPPGPISTFFGAGVEFRRRYKAADAQILCPATTSTAPVECVEDAFAGPTRAKEFNLFGLARARFGDRFPIAVEIRGAYDVNNDVFGIEVPVYFIPAGDGGLRAGIRVGWDSEEDDVRGSFFIGVPFDLLGGP